MEEGKLPNGFSPFKENDLHITGTPFEAYLNELWQKVDSVKNESGINAWYQLDRSIEINAAAKAISEWYDHHKKMNEFLSQRCHFEHTYFSPPFDFGWGKKVMIVLANRSQFDTISKRNIQKCKDRGISFCVILSDHELYDLMEETKVQKRVPLRGRSLRFLLLDNAFAVA